MKKFRNFMCLILSVIMIFSCSFCAYADTTESVATSDGEKISGEEAAKYIAEAASLVMARYKFDVKKEDLYREALAAILKENPQLLESAFKGMFESLDDYSVYYTDEELNSFLDNMSGEICGIGVLVTADAKGLIISNVYDNTPAKEAGLMQGDVITHAGGVFLGGMDIDLAKQHIIGEENTPVTLTITRYNDSFEKTLVRRKVTIDSGFYQIVENGTIGYIQLSEFSNNAAEFIEKALAEFDKKGIKNVIMDLRNNPGGGLNELVDVCSLFIPSGPAIHLEYKNPLKFYTLYAQNKNKKPKYNLAVLINENSASASEAFSAAVQDTGVGIVIGQKSFGKGTMQNITPFKIGGGIKLTEAVYLSPNKREVNGVGVTPDVLAPDKITTYHKADLQPVTYDRILKSGDTGADVTAIEERLRILGFSVGVPDEVFDTQTHIATLNFQKAANLPATGEMDLATQVKLENMLNASQVKSDTSYKKAVEIFRKGTWKEYKQDWSMSQ